MAAESNRYSIAARDDISYYSDERLEHLARETVKRTVKLFEATQPRGGDMPVVLASGSSPVPFSALYRRAVLGRKSRSVLYNRGGWVFLVASF